MPARAWQAGPDFPRRPILELLTAATPPREALPDGVFEQALEDLELGEADFSRCYLALGKISGAEVRDDRRAEVCAALGPLAHESNLPLRVGAIEALGRTGRQAVCRQPSTDPQCGILPASGG